MSDLEHQLPSAEFDVELVQGGVKAAMKDAGATSRDLLMVPIDKLVVVAGLNVRIHDDDYEKHVEEVKRSILENGFYQHKPLPCYAGKDGDSTIIYVAGGFTRLEAAKRAIKEGAAIEALPVVMKPPGTSMLDLTLALDADNIGTPLRPYERAVVIKRALNFGADEETIAKKLSITKQYVGELLYLMSLPHALQMQVASGRASAGHAVNLAKKLGPAEALKAFETAPVGATAEAAEAEAETAATPAPARVRPRATAAASGEPTISKKTLFRAIDYAIALPGDGIPWLTLWRKTDKDALAELAAYKPPRKNAKNPPAPEPSKAVAKARAKKGGNSGRDPFDTGTSNVTTLHPDNAPL